MSRCKHTVDGQHINDGTSECLACGRHLPLPWSERVALALTVGALIGLILWSALGAK